MSLTISEYIKYFAHLFHLEKFSHTFSFSRDWFETLSIQLKTISESFLPIDIIDKVTSYMNYYYLHLAVFLIFTNGSIELNFEHFLRGFALTTLHIVEWWEALICRLRLFVLCALFVLRAYPRWIYTDQIVLEVSGSLVECQAICVAIDALHLLNWPVLFLHVYYGQVTFTFLQLLLLGLHLIEF